MMTWIPEALQLGPLTLPIDRLALILGLLLGLYLLQTFLTRAGYGGKAVASVVFESGVLAFFVALLSPAVLQLREVIAHPISALFGGITTAGIGIGVVVFVIALWWKCRSIRPFPPLPVLLDAVVAGVMVGWALYSFAVEAYGIKIGSAGSWYHPIFLYRTVLLLIGFWWVSRSVRGSCSGIGGAVGLVWIGWMQLLLSLVEANSPVFLNLTSTQLGGLFLSVLGILLHRRYRRGTLLKGA